MNEQPMPKEKKCLMYCLILQLGENVVLLYKSSIKLPIPALVTVCLLKRLSQMTKKIKLCLKIFRIVRSTLISIN